MEMIDSCWQFQVYTIRLILKKVKKLAKHTRQDLKCSLRLSLQIFPQVICNE